MEIEIGENLMTAIISSFAAIAVAVAAYSLFAACSKWDRYKVSKNIELEFAARWALKALEAVPCPDTQCGGDGVIAEGDPDNPNLYPCEWCAMKDNLKDALDNIPKTKIRIICSNCGAPWVNSHVCGGEQF